VAKVQIKGEWKLWVGLAGFFLLGVVYLYYVSRPPMEGDEYLWSVTKVVSPKRLSLKGSGKQIEFVLAGLAVPKSQESTAQKMLEKTLTGRWVRIKPLKGSSKDVQEGLVFLSGEDLLARMIRQGLGQVSRTEKGFDIRPYIELELEAKRAKRGLWAHPTAGAK
jgi:endonuclease YncB( thermonuclease family)